MYGRFLVHLAEVVLFNWVSGPVLQNRGLEHWLTINRKLEACLVPI